MRKFLALVLSVAALASVVLSVAALASAGPDIRYCDPLQSTLCSSVSMVFEFEEDSDRPRYDSTSGIVALEPDGYDVARRAGKVGSYAAEFAASENSYLRLPGVDSIGPGYWTMTMWVYPDVLGASGQVQTLMANDYKAQAGTHVYLQNVGGSLKLKIDVTAAETGVVLTATAGSNLTVGAWNFVAVGASQWPTQYGQANLFAQVNNSTRGNTALTYSVRGANFETYLGARVMQPSGSRTPFDGAIDALYMFGALNAAQLTNVYGAGSGKAYPFVD